MSDIQTRTVPYDHAGTALEGWLASPAGDTPRPVVLLVHEWRGLGDHVRARAEQIAGWGWHGFAVDVFGAGVRPTTIEDCSANMMIYVNDRDLLRARLHAALDWIRAQPGVDGTRVAILGFCFGGLASMELARSGADIKLAASFHGNLSTRDPAEAQNIRCPVLACHGADDLLVTQDVVAGFEREMSDAGVDWTVVQFGGVMHSFTNPQANDPGFGTVYDAGADRRAFGLLRQYLDDVFA